MRKPSKVLVPRRPTALPNTEGFATDATFDGRFGAPVADAGAVG